MRVVAIPLPEVLILEPTVFGDERGFFLESFNQRAFDEAVGQHVEFVQDNHSRSQRGVLRGLHYQLPPHAQGKLVRVVNGRAFDVVVDMRRSSATFGRWAGTELDAAEHKQIWIPPGFAHGFLVLSDAADFLYKTTAYYTPAAEAAVRWDDRQIAIAWPDPGVTPRLSERDRVAPSFALASTFD
ncbi:MAG TPA: dTDP-4-dehydrorhamnose 3,5-epimerase [Burkholderiaceae bacterium]|nr:dTDP-4-dehydrorhamnose 3,5-epimerase [Burkholderiaceae bacterium]